MRYQKSIPLTRTLGTGQAICHECGSVYNLFDKDCSCREKEIATTFVFENTHKDLPELPRAKVRSNNFVFRPKSGKRKARKLERQRKKKNRRK